MKHYADNYEDLTGHVPGNEPGAPVEAEPATATPKRASRKAATTEE